MGSEDSAEQSRGPMNKHRMRGLPARTSERPIAKSTVIKGRGGKSGGYAVKAVGLTSGDLRCVPASGLRSPQGDLTAAQKSAEGVVGGSVPLKAQTMEVVSRAVISHDPMRPEDRKIRAI